MVVDSLDIKNNFTVAGGTPVTGDDLQKVQNQIIAPSQTIWIDCLDGSDENDGKTKQTAVETINKAFSLINAQVPSIEFKLVNADRQERIYPVTCLNFFGYTSIKNINITTEEITGSSAVQPIIKVKYSENIDTYTTPKTYWYGNILIANATDKYVGLSGIKIQLDDYCPIDGKYKLFLLDVKDVNFYHVNIDISRELSVILVQAVDEANLTTNTINNNISGFLFAYHWDIARYTESPVENPEATGTNYYSTPQVALTSLIRSTNIPANLQKYAPSVGLIYSNV